MYVFLYIIYYRSTSARARYEWWVQQVYVGLSSSFSARTILSQGIGSIQQSGQVTVSALVHVAVQAAHAQQQVNTFGNILEENLTHGKQA